MITTQPQATANTSKITTMTNIANIAITRSINKVVVIISKLPPPQAVGFQAALAGRRTRLPTASGPLSAETIGDRQVVETKDKGLFRV